MPLATETASPSVETGPGMMAGRWHWRMQAAAASLFALLSVAGFSFELPPYFVSTIWGASGCALAFVVCYGPRLLLGVGAGALIANLLLLTSAFELKTEPRILLTALLSSSAVVLQTALIAWLLRHGVRVDRLSRPGEIVQALLLAGPIGTAIGAGVGVGSYAWAGGFGSDSLAHRWFNWWLCESAGAMLLFAITFMGLRRHYLGVRRALVVALPLLLLVAMVSAVYHYVRDQESQSVQAGWRQQTGTLQRSLVQTLRAQVDIARVIRAHLESQADIERQRFERFAATVLQSDPAIFSIGWLPQVGGAKRGDFEASVEREFGQDPGVRSTAPRGGLQPAAEQTVYYPLQYMRSRYSDGDLSRGIDWASVPGLGAVLAKALSRDGPVLTPVYNYAIGDQPAERFVILVTPVLAESCQRPLNLGSPCVRGMVAIILRVSSLARQAWGDLAPMDVRLELTDEVDGSLLLRHGGDMQIAPEYAFEASVEAVDRQWRLQVHPQTLQLLARRSGQTWGILLLLGVSAGLTAWVLLLGSGHSLEMQRRVAGETRALKEALRRSDERLDTLRSTCRGLLPLLQSNLYRQRSAAMELATREDGLQLEELSRLEELRGDAGQGLRELQWLELQCELDGESGELQEVNLEALLELALAQHEPEAQRRGTRIRREMHSVPRLLQDGRLLLLVVDAMLERVLAQPQLSVCQVLLEAAMEQGRAGVALTVEGTAGESVPAQWHWQVAEAWVARWGGRLTCSDRGVLRCRLWLPLRGGGHA